MDPKEIENLTANVTMTAGQWNVVLACLMNGPFNQVAPIIQEIKRQADPQIDAEIAKRKPLTGDEKLQIQPEKTVMPLAAKLVSEPKRRGRPPKKG